MSTVDQCFAARTTVQSMRTDLTAIEQLPRRRQ